MSSSPPTPMCSGSGVATTRAATPTPPVAPASSASWTVGAAGELGDEGPVDLETVDGESVQIAEPAVAGAEVVDGTRPPEGSQLLELVDGELQAVECGALRELELEALPVETGDPQGPAHILGQALPQLAGRHVDRHRERGEPGRRPGLKLLAGGGDDERAEGRDEPGLLRQGDEGVGEHQSPLRALPANQRLGAGDPARPDVHLGLVMEDELLPLQPPAQRRLEGEALVGLGAQGRAEDLER